MGVRRLGRFEGGEEERLVGLGEIVSAGSSEDSSRREEAWAVGLKEPPPPKGPELPGNLDSAIIRVRR